jgi:hypothetical protein
MSVLQRLRELLKPTPKSPEDIAAAAEAARLHDDLETARLSQRSMAGANYQSGRDSHHQ